MTLKENLSYQFLYKFYLESVTSGMSGEFAKHYFPNDYKEMKKSLEDIKKEAKIKIVNYYLPKTIQDITDSIKKLKIAVDNLCNNHKDG